MVPKGSPRDMNKWRETLRDPNIRFPGESSEYRRARNQLLKRHFSWAWGQLFQTETGG